MCEVRKLFGDEDEDERNLKPLLRFPSRHLIPEIDSLSCL